MSTSIEDVINAVGQTKSKPTIFYVQRDTRTTIQFKKFLVIWFFITSIFGILSLCGFIVFKFIVPSWKTEAASNYFSDQVAVLDYILIGLVAGYAVFALVLIFQWRWMWLIPKRRLPPKYGEDIEDLSPAILAKSGHQLGLHSSTLKDNIFEEVEKMYADFEKIDNEKM